MNLRHLFGVAPIGTPGEFNEATGKASPAASKPAPVALTLERNNAMKRLRRLWTVTLLFLLIASSAFAWAARPPEIYGQKHHGIIVAVPEGRTGIWSITGERVEVTKDTYFDERMGKAEPGAFVEAFGKKQGNVFRAYMIEVKLPSKR